MKCTSSGVQKNNTHTFYNETESMSFILSHAWWSTSEFDIELKLLEKTVPHGIVQVILLIHDETIEIKPSIPYSNENMSHFYWFNRTISKVIKTLF